MRPRTPKVKAKSQSQWFAPVMGAIGGAVYIFIDERFAKGFLGITAPGVIGFIHNVVDFVLPVLFGILIGVAINAANKQALSNQKLSIQNTKLQRDLLVNTLTSLFLHEIRNPIHNIAAALEDSRTALPVDIDEMIQRNLKRLTQTTEQYRKWGSHFESIDPKEKTELRPWLKEFTENKARSKLRELNIEYTQDADSLLVHMHPVLLEQAFTTLFSNACEALSKEKGERKLLLTAHRQPPHHEKVEIKLTNRGPAFRDEVLEIQGRTPIESKTGWGLGLTLLRRALEQVEGEIFLSNVEGHAEVTLIIPGEAR